MRVEDQSERLDEGRRQPRRNCGNKKERRQFEDRCLGQPQPGLERNVLMLETCILRKRITKYVHNKEQ